MWTNKIHITITSEPGQSIVQSNVDEEEVGGVFPVKFEVHREYNEVHYYGGNSDAKAKHSEHNV